MMDMRKVSGMVLTLKCDKCGAIFPHFRFEGDADSDTAGVGSLSSCSVNELLIAELTSDEWNSNEALDGFEKRINILLGRTDLRRVRLLRTEDKNNVPLGISFRDFLGTYTPPKMIFSCVCCAMGESEILFESSPSAFCQEGGKILMFGDLILDDGNCS